MATYAFTVEDPIDQCHSCPMYKHLKLAEFRSTFCALTMEEISVSQALDEKPYECPLHELSWDDVQAVALSRSRVNSGE